MLTYMRTWLPSGPQPTTGRRLPPEVLPCQLQVAAAVTQVLMEWTSSKWYYPLVLPSITLRARR